MHEDFSMNPGKLGKKVHPPLVIVTFSFLWDFYSSYFLFPGLDGGGVRMRDLYEHLFSYCTSLFNKPAQAS